MLTPRINFPAVSLCVLSLLLSRGDVCCQSRDPKLKLQLCGALFSVRAKRERAPCACLLLQLATNKTAGPFKVHTHHGPCRFSHLGTDPRAPKPWTLDPNAPRDRGALLLAVAVAPMCSVSVPGAIVRVLISPREVPESFLKPRSPGVSGSGLCEAVQIYCIR